MAAAAWRAGAGSTSSASSRSGSTDHLANPIRPERPWLDGWTALPALAARDGARTGGRSRQLAHPAQPGRAREGGGDARPHHRRPGGARARRGRVQARRRAGRQAVGDVRASSFERTVEVLGDDSLQPRPVQERIPLTIGGHSEEALELAARYADRWNTWGGPGLEPAEAVRRARERNDRLTTLCEQAGRDPTALTRSILLGLPVRPRDAVAVGGRVPGRRRALVPGGLRRADRLLPARDRDARGQRYPGRVRARRRRCSVTRRFIARRRGTPRRSRNSRRRWDARPARMAAGRRTQTV